MHSGCVHYDPTSRHAGRCALGIYGAGTVSPGTCLVQCQSFTGNETLRAAYRRRVMLTANGIDVRTMQPAVAVTVHRWLGIDWIGKPWPLRLRVRTSWPFVAIEDAPGCGCIMRLKRLWQRLRPAKPKKGCGCRSSAST